MSNKTQLQTNNTTLNSYLARLNAAKDTIINFGNLSVQDIDISLPNSGTNKSKLQLNNTTLTEYITRISAAAQIVSELPGEEDITLAPGLYEIGAETLIKSWDVLVADGDITMSGTNVTACNTSLVGDLYIPDSVTSIEDRAFNGCTGLTSVIIGNGVKSIGGNAFSYCTGLTDVTIGNSVTYIGGSAFTNCTGLTRATFKNTTGWNAGNASLSSSDLSNPSIAARYLKYTYCSSTWTRS